MPGRESFAVLEAEMEGRPLVANVDLSLNAFADHASFPWFLSLSTPLKDATKRGLPTELEANALNAWEDEVEAALRPVVAFKYVGRVTWNGHRELLFQLAEPKSAAATLQRMIDARTTRPFAFRCEHDESWTHVSAYLAT